MEYYEAPNTRYWDSRLTRVFLAGGITGCVNWQSSVVDMFEQLDTPAAVLNPRRENFPIRDPRAAQEQITWEFDALSAAHVILFWFPDSGNVTQPIALYELGRYVALGKTVVVGRNPQYVRRQDVDIQLKLARPELTVHQRLLDVVEDANEVVRGLAGARR